MKLLKKILLPINPGYYSNESLKFAIELAKLYQSEIILLYISYKDLGYQNISEMTQTQEKDHIKKVHGKIKSGGIQKVESVIDYGNHIDKIVITALKYNVNLVLFGIVNVTESGSNILDLIIEKVIRHCDKPVWVVKKGFSGKIKNILCPVDFSDASRRAVLNSVHLAREFKANLTLLSVFSPISKKFPFLTGGFLHENEDLQQKHKQHLKEFLNSLSFSNIEWNYTLRTGEPYKEILNECNSKKYDLIIMGSHGHTGLSRIMMGSVTEKVIRQISLSFITTKSEDILNLRLENKISNIKNHYNLAKQKQNMNSLDEAIGEYLICLSYNEMHIPSLLGLSEVYGKKGETEKELRYKKMASELISKLFGDTIKKSQL